MDKKFALEVDGQGKFDISTPALVKKAMDYFVKNETDIPGVHRVKMAESIVGEMGAEFAPEALLRYSHPVFRPEMQELIAKEAQFVNGEFVKVAEELAVKAPDMDHAVVGAMLTDLRAERTNHVKVAHDMDPYQIAYPEAGKKYRDKMMDKLAFERVSAMSEKDLSKVLVKKAMRQVKDGNYQYYTSLSGSIRGKLETMAK